MSDLLTNPHDKFFRETFSRQEVAHDFVQYYLPPEVVALLDLTTLEISKDSFIDSELKEHFLDLLYQVALQDGPAVYVYLLFDHKSYVDSLVSLQLLGYMERIWTLSLKQQRANRKERPKSTEKLRLPPIFPLVVYHGEEPWQVSTEFIELFGNLPPALQRYVPNYQYWLCDLSQYSDDDIVGYVILRTGLLELKYIYEPSFGERLPQFIKLLEELADRPTALGYVEVMLRYAFNASKHLTDEQFRGVLTDIFDKEETTFMPTLAELWLERGIEKGLEKGRQEGIIKGHKEGQQALAQTVARILVIRAMAELEQAMTLLKDLPLTLLTELSEIALTVNSFAEFQTALQQRLAKMPPPKNNEL